MLYFTCNHGLTPEGSYRIIELSFESSFELLDSLLDEMTQS